MRSLRLAAVLAVVVMGSTGSADAATWQSLQTSGQLNVSDLVGTARDTGGALHVAWPRRTPDSLYDLMQTPVSKAGKVGAPVPIATGWAGIEGPTLLPSGSALFAFFSGTRTTVTGDPTEGLDMAISADQGATWNVSPTAAAAGDFLIGRDASVALGPNGALSSWYAGEETVAHLGTDPATPNQRGYGSGTNQAIAVSGGKALVAWCTGVQGPDGVFVQPVDPASAAPAGAATLVPGSLTGTEAFCPAAARVPLVARQDKGFFVATVDGSRRAVHAWSFGAAKAQTVSSGSGYKQFVAAAASPGSKASVWVGWLADDGTFEVRRSNPNASVFGATVTVKGPRDGSVYGLDLDAQADRVDLIARVQHDDGSIGLETTQSFPGLTLEAAGGRKPSFRVLDAGDPVKGAKVTVAGHSGTTAANGRVTIAGVKPGHYTARAAKTRYVDAAAGVTVRR